MFTLFNYAYKRFQNDSIVVSVQIDPDTAMCDVLYRQRCVRKDRRMIGRRYTGDNGREVEIRE
jgi:hypothetical protein